MPASTTFDGVSKSGSPISRWIISLPCFSSARARFRTSNAVSVPSRDIRPARRNSNIVVGSMTADGIITPQRLAWPISQSHGRTDAAQPRRSLDCVMLPSLHMLPWKAISHLFGLPQMTAIMSQDDHQPGADRETEQTHKGILETDAVEVQVKTSMD